MPAYLHFQFEPVVQKGHESLVHHILIFKCPAVDPKYIGYEYICGDDHGPHPCDKVMVAWATGGEVW